MATEQARPASQKFPAGLAGVLNPSDDNRDSAYYSSTDASSKRAILSPTNSGFHESNGDKTPSPVSTNLLPQPLVSPVTSNMSVASIVSPTNPTRADPRLVDRTYSIDSSAALNCDAEPMSRRESVDSRINQEFGGMRLGPSPYASANHSTTSIQNTLQQQRNPRTGLDTLSIHRISNGYQPSTERIPLDNQIKAIRTAPTITGPTTGTIARAAEPTKGQAWAFPEDEMQRLPSGAHSLIDSRRSSVADSFASSQFTAESRLPPGQRRLDEGLATPDYHRMSSNSGEFPAVHHHSLQHRQLGDLQAEEANGHAGAQPYSRTPELRVSHKLAERKRRTEMKELFEQLRDLMPQERGSKASKWEILTKAISEHQRQNDTIKYLQQQHHSVVSDLEMQRRELAALRMENSQLRGELTAVSTNHAGANHNTAAPAAGFQARDTQRPELPPLRSLSGDIPTVPESMTGVQYSEQPRMSGYRTSDARY
ncbi:hypothetical protein M406DRAFT_337480 [Cryphonectria parasitica EP155]|uniref:BHLH domain-containing protein n=1 Tax=Cryphonectria parasitica (strain ATCC 38755 / EP155) TaxID=660469 RepID=A0A9P4Y927_CRYP1|nr:uncharacterized protein M406DRAFT_337480 [Cryphonectria parasitica EP155]KAF3769222.1 hypothetical protein M406DRAFT_337480 [Cryphonectria parasitica EP155]